MGKTKKTPKTFSKFDLVNIQAKTERQKDFFRAYFGQQVPIIVQSGSAGTGKTLVALFAALRDVFDEDTPANKVAIIRSAVTARDIGFLPGTEDEKNAVYEEIYAGICDEIMNYQWRNYENLVNANIIEFHNTSLLRGKTFDNTVVVFDEFQSCSYHEMSTAITRLGKGSRIVMCGDIRQSDLHKRGDVSGYAQLMKVLENMDPSLVETITYTPDDIVRSGLVKDFLKAEEYTA